MPGIQCALCSLWFASELGLKIHYSKKHSPVAECNRKRKAACNSTQNKYLNDDMLWALCEAFAEPGEEDKELPVINGVACLPSSPESIGPESILENRTKRLFVKEKYVNGNGQSMSDLQCSDRCHVMQNQSSHDSLSNYDMDVEEVDEEETAGDEEDNSTDEDSIDQENLILDESQDVFLDPVVEVDVIDTEKEEVNDISLITLLDDYESEKITKVIFLWNWKLVLNCCLCSRNQMQASNCMEGSFLGLSKFSQD